MRKYHDKILETVKEIFMVNFPSSLKGEVWDEISPQLSVKTVLSMHNNKHWEMVFELQFANEDPISPTSQLGVVMVRESFDLVKKEFDTIEL